MNFHDSSVLSVLAMRPMKKSTVVNSWNETRREPYQNTRAMTKNENDCDSEYRPFDQTAVLLDFCIGSSRDSLYRRKQSSSRVNDATVRMEAAASQANWAESSCAFLFDWSFKTTTRCIAQRLVRACRSKTDEKYLPGEYNRSILREEHRLDGETVRQ